MDALPSSIAAQHATPLGGTAADDVPQRVRRTLDDALAKAQALDDVWVFGYASLIWRPEFDAVEKRDAKLLGWHRALRMHSRINRGTPERPGLVFALLNGGACRGVAFRLSPQHWRDDLTRLWEREMITAVYAPRWLQCRTPQGTVSALTFTLDRLHPSHTGPINDATMLDILRHARGRYGTTLDYLLDTARGLRALGIHDREIERLVALAAKAGIAMDHAAAIRSVGAAASPVAEGNGAAPCAAARLISNAG